MCIDRGAASCCDCFNHPSKLRHVYVHLLPLAALLLLPALALPSTTTRPRTPPPPGPPALATAVLLSALEAWRSLLLHV